MTLAISLLLLAQTLDEGAAKLRAGDYMGAREVLRAVDAGPLRDVLLGIAEANSGQCRAAAGRLAVRYEVAELRRMAGVVRVQCLLVEDQVGEAVRVAVELAREFPSDEDVLYQTARAHMRAFNDTVAAMFERTPASWRVNQLSGEILDVQGRPGDAAQEYRKAIAKNPVALNLHYRLGRALLMEGKADEAREQFLEELKRNPGDAVAEYQVAQLDGLKGKREEAAARYARAVELKPDFVEAMVALAKLRPDGAIGLLEKAVGLAPANEAARYQLMIAYRNAGRMTDAERERAAIEKLRKPPEGEFADFLKRLGEKPQP